MRKFMFVTLVGLIGIWGCSTTSIPNYLQNKNPYERRYYVSFEEAHLAVTNTLLALGWGIEEQVDPAIYEHRPEDQEIRQVMLITKTRGLPFFLGTRYGKMNVFLRHKNTVTEIEIRYMTVTSFLFKNFISYRNNSAVRRIFDKISSVLNAEPAS